MAMLEVKDLEVYYGVIQALKGISFDVDQGDIVALIGANGAGKTTTLHTSDVYKRQVKRKSRKDHLRGKRHYPHSGL